MSYRHVSIATAHRTAMREYSDHLRYKKNIRLFDALPLKERRELYKKYINRRQDVCFIKEHEKNIIMKKLKKESDE